MTLAERSMWIADALAKRYTRPRFDQDDLAQIGREELVRCERDWQGRGSFELYAWTRVRRRILDEFRRELGRDGQRADDTEPLPPDWGQVTDDDRVDARAAMAAVLLLPRQERVVVVARACGFTLREAGGMLGVSESRACQLEARAVRTLRAAA